MKKLLLSFILTIIVSIVFAQWIPQSSGVSASLSGMSFVDSNTGWVCGSTNSTYVLRTTDGGDNWTIQYEDSGYYFGSIFFLNESTGWAIGGNPPPGNESILIHTEDGGISWEEQDIGNRGFLHSIQFTSQDTGWIASASLLKTIDGGDTWQDIEAVNGIVYNVFFLNHDVGWTVGVIGATLYGSIFHTIDGGLTWEEQTSGTDLSLYDVFFINESVGWAIGDAQTILFTDNGGNTWITQYSTSWQDGVFLGVHFVDAENGWVVGSGGIIMHTTDGGVNWEEQTGGAGSSLRDITFTDANNGWICGSNGTILYTNNGGTTFIDDFSNSTDYLFYRTSPNPFSTSTTIEYQLTTPQTVRITFYNQFGKQVDIVKEKQQKGLNRIEWTSKNLADGIYFFRLKAGEQVASGKVVFLNTRQ